MSLYEGESCHSEIYATTNRARAGTAEKKGSTPIKLAELKKTESGYDVTNCSVYDIHNLLESEEGECLEWIGEKLIMKVESLAEDQGAMWILDYRTAFRESGWQFGRSTHLPSANHATIPDMHGFFRPALTFFQGRHAMAPKPMPQWVLEVEWNSLVNAENKGFRKIRETLFNQVGSDGSRIEEAWLLALPDGEGVETEDVVELPEDEHILIEAQNEQPDADHAFLAVLRREAGAWPPVAYYDLAPNRRFLPPWYSVFGPQGPAGQPGAPALSTNHLLKDTLYINLVDAPPAPVEQQL